MNVLLCRRCVFGLFLAASLVAPGRAADSFSSIYISEFAADNQHGLKDEDGECSAWIELYNAGSSPVNLKGWFLTDTATNLAKWRFPGLVLLPDKYLLVFASGKDRSKSLTHPHTSFRLDKHGGYLALVKPNTNVLSEFAPAYPPQRPDVSYGRLRGEPSLRGYFPRPTPGAPNATAGPGFAPEVVFSRPAGPFTAQFALELSNRASNAVIRYTLDGALPTSASPIYRAPLLVTNTALVRARVYQDGLLPGPPRTGAYLLLHTNLTDFTSTLPLVIMDTFGKDLPAGPRSSSVHLSFYEPVNGKTSLTNSPRLSTRAGFHTRGSSSSGLPQPGFAVQFLDEFNQERARSPLGLPADSDWVLYAPNGYEPVMIHNPFIHQLSREMGRYSPRTRFVEVYLARGSGPVTSLDYGGIYVLEEKIKVGKQRVNIDRLGPEDLKPPQVTGGYLFKFDRLGPGEGGFSAGGASMVYIEPKEPIITLPQRSPQEHYLSSYFNDFDRALNGPDWRDPATGYRAYIDVDSWIDYHVVEVLSGNVDSMVFSTYLHKPRGGKIMFGPHWDFDRALGSTDGRDSDPRQWNTGPFFGGAWWPRLFSDPDFWQLWVDRWQELRLTHFSQTNLESLIDRLTGELREAQPRQVRKWGLEPRGGSYQSEIDLMKSWLSNRIDFIDTQLTQPPRLSQPPGPVAAGSLLALSGSTNALVYYTLDGSDPRLSQGAISSNAVLYTNPVRLTNTVRFVARARNPSRHQVGGPQSSTPWSRPLRARFVVGSP